MNKIQEIHIQGRLWFQKTYGNTYNTTKTLVFYDDGSIKTFYTPIQYGYGTHYQTVAAQNLVKEGILPEKSDGSYYFWRDYEDLGIKVFSNSIDVLKKDLHKAV